MLKIFANKFFTSILGLVMILTSIPMMTACSSSQALTEVQKFEPVVVNALNLACVFTTSPLCTTDEATIQNDYNSVIKVWGDYNVAVAAGTATQAQWNYLNAAFTTFELDSASVFSLASGVNQAEVTAVVASAQLLLAAIEAMFPASPVAARGPSLFASHHVANQKYNSTWLASWTKDYNNKIDAAQKSHPKLKLHKVHVHSTPVRYATFGLLK